MLCPLLSDARGAVQCPEAARDVTQPSLVPGVKAKLQQPGCAWWCDGGRTGYTGCAVAVLPHYLQGLAGDLQRVLDRPR